jgi:hypothetical protein
MDVLVAQQQLSIALGMGLHLTAISIWQSLPQGPCCLPSFLPQHDDIVEKDQLNCFSLTFASSSLSASIN